MMKAFVFVGLLITLSGCVAGSQGVILGGTANNGPSAVRTNKATLTLEYFPTYQIPYIPGVTVDYASVTPPFSVAETRFDTKVRDPLPGELVFFFLRVRKPGESQSASLLALSGRSVNFATPSIEVGKFVAPTEYDPTEPGSTPLRLLSGPTSVAVKTANAGSVSYGILDVTDITGDAITCKVFSRLDGEKVFPR